MKWERVSPDRDCAGSSAGVPVQQQRVPARPFPSSSYTRTVPLSLPHLFYVAQVLNPAGSIQMTETLLNCQPFSPQAPFRKGWPARGEGSRPHLSGRHVSAARRAARRSLAPCFPLGWKLEPLGQRFWVKAAFGAEVLARKDGTGGI